MKIKHTFPIVCLLVLFSWIPLSSQELKREFNAVPFTQVRLTDSFWAPRIEVNRRISVPHNIDWCENQTGRINNFKIASGQMEGKFSGIYFDDSDVYKILEGFAYTLAAFPDKKLEATARQWIDYIAAVQEEDGYLMCYFKLVKPKEKWTNLASMHELYCAGHMAEAAVAWYRATGDDKFLKVNCRLMDLICKRYGLGAGQLINIAGHEEIELALVKLYELTGEKKYLEEAKFFIDHRGVAAGREKGLFGEYCQDNKPIREQSEIVGHAVRAMYLYAGATDIAGYYKDAELMAAMNRLWNNVTRRKMYITGGIGSHAKNEGFGEEFFLPNKSAYAETCAAIGLVLWAHRMNLATGDTQYADIMKQVMYNGMLSGYGFGGDSYFYVNPLESNGNHHRQPFFGCACCPSNVIRIIAAIPGYVYATSQSEQRKKAGLSGDDTIVVNMFVNSNATIELADGTVEISQKTDYPFEGKVEVTTTAKPKKGKEKSKYYIVLDYTKPGEKSTVSSAVFEEKKPLCLSYNEPMDVIRMAANPKVQDDNGRVAIMRGPLVYCFEQCDNTVPVNRIILAKDPQFKVEMRNNYISTDKDSTLTKNSPMRKVAVITCKDWQGKTLTAIPYYAWDNREAGKMNVWVYQEGLDSNLDREWTDSKGEPVLYKPLNTNLLTDQKPIITEQPSFSASFANDGNSTFDGSEPGIKPENSCDHKVPRATFWDHKGTAEWFEYEYSEPKVISQVSVYWFDDTGRGQCRVPQSWKLVYREKENGPWKEVETTDSYSVELNKEINVHIKPVKAQCLRLNIQLQKNFSGGILQWIAK